MAFPLTYHRECGNCGISFIGRSGVARYCSKICKSRANNQQKRSQLYIDNCKSCGYERRSKTKRKVDDSGLCSPCSRRNWSGVYPYRYLPRNQRPNAWSKRHKKQANQSISQRNEDIRLEMITAYGGKCVHCNITNPIVLVLDHIHDDGNLERKNRPGGVSFYRFLKKIDWPQDRLQLLCHNCNFQKEYIRKKRKSGHPSKILNLVGVA